MNCSSRGSCHTRSPHGAAHIRLHRIRPSGESSVSGGGWHRPPPILRPTHADRRATEVAGFAASSVLDPQTSPLSHQPRLACMLRHHPRYSEHVRSPAPPPHHPGRWPRPSLLRAPASSTPRRRSVLLDAQRASSVELREPQADVALCGRNPRKQPRAATSPRPKGASLVERAEGPDSVFTSQSCRLAHQSFAVNHALTEVSFRAR